MLSPSRLSLSVIALSMGFLSAPALKAGDEQIRPFPAQKCSFKLPGPDWNWIERTPSTPPSVLCTLRNKEGIVVTLAATQWLETIPQSDAFRAEFDKLFFSKGEMEKKPGYYLRFKTRMAYQGLGVLPDKRITVIRIFAAHSLTYTITIVGVLDPFGFDPRINPICECFDYTEQPPPEVQRQASPNTTSTQPGGGSSYGRTLGVTQIFIGIAVFCVLAAGGLAGFKYLTRKPEVTPKRKKKRTVVQDEDE